MPPEAKEDGKGAEFPGLAEAAHRDKRPRWLRMFCSSSLAGGAWATKPG